MFSATARHYDTLYCERDFEGEVGLVLELVARHRAAPRTLLDVACATGGHLAHFAARLGADAVAGLELDPALAALARTKLPAVRITEGDITRFELEQRFDAVTCLYGSIAYVETRARLFTAVAELARHLAPGGVLVLDPWWMRAEDVAPAAVRHVDRARVKIALLGRAAVEGGVAALEIHYLVAELEPGGAPARVEHLVEHHRCGIFSRSDHEAALAAAGLAPHYDARGPVGRGVFAGVAPS